MKNKRTAEILLPPAIVSFTIVTCFYFLVEHTHSENTLRSLLLLIVIFLVLIVGCLVNLFQKGESNTVSKRDKEE